MTRIELDLQERAAAQLEHLTALLLDNLNSNDHWTGELSSSALATAVASVALQQIGSGSGALVQDGLEWLAGNVNPDGGWGDTIRSQSNISTTALCWAAFGAAQADSRFQSTVQGAAEWLKRTAGSLDRLPEAIILRYGKDRTFSVPILMTLAISGRLKPGAWRNIPALPFELSVLPRGLFGLLRLPVVSYALPALIAIGNAVHHHAPSRNPFARGLRTRCAPRALKLLAEIQPSNGGFLEATPLTAFVAMSLASAGHGEHIVAQRAASFLRASVRADGSWPIDTNLATWVTTLAVKALSHQSGLRAYAERGRIRAWLERHQTSSMHAYTGAAAGAWAWTDLPGGVPDADDTAGALLALGHLGGETKAAEQGIEWLLNLQNRDGGIPTFCRGWGTLPFDRSTPEVTAHALRAFTRWRSQINPRLAERADRAIIRALRYLTRVQNPDGSFIPLWFGNEHSPEQNNPVYGTAQVLIALNDIQARGTFEIRRKAAQFLAASQTATGGWGGSRDTPETVEETSLAVEALCSCPDPSQHLERGLSRLLDLLEANAWKEPAPIGLYFARLWYFERLYPLIFALSALGKFTTQLNRPVSADAESAS